jgi:hypothetical protein
MGPCIVSIFQYISNKIQRCTVYLYLETALHVSGGTSTRHQERINCIYSIWYLSHHYCYLPLSWFECAVGGVRRPQHTQTGFNYSTKAADSSNGVTNTRCCRYSLCSPGDGWKYHPKHVEQFPDINKLCKVVSCWKYEYIGILLGAHRILHISRIRVNGSKCKGRLVPTFRVVCRSCS